MSFPCQRLVAAVRLILDPDAYRATHPHTPRPRRAGPPAPSPPAPGPPEHTDRPIGPSVPSLPPAAASAPAAESTGSPAPTPTPAVNDAVFENIVEIKPEEKTEKSDDQISHD